MCDCVLLNWLKYIIVKTVESIIKNKQLNMSPDDGPMRSETCRANISAE